LFRKSGAFNVAEQHIKRPIFLQTEEASRCGNLSIEGAASLQASGTIYVLLSEMLLRTYI
jgi:hypothetical protein